MKEKTLEDWFNERNKEFPKRGKYINLCFTVHHSGARRKEITEAFNKLIPKEEYDKEEKQELINYLVKKSNE